jgi:hypothetical protein
MVTAETFNSMRQDLDKLKLDGNVNADGFLDGHLGEACKPYRTTTNSRCNKISSVGGGLSTILGGIV